ncbi:hypothetical protein LUZ60_011282 [Juncus effusus]|nr:hypothetical protein LUZ60_011282 [Juncus effusus]
MNDLMTDSFVGGHPQNPDLESGSDPSLRKFFTEAEAANHEMLSIQALLAQITTENESRKTEHRREVLRSLSKRINGEMAEAVRKARVVRGRLEAMDRKVDRKDGNRVGVVRGLSLKLREVMGQFQGLRGRMVEEDREAVRRCYYTITGENPSEEVIEGILSSGVHVQELLVKKAVSEGDQGVANLVQEMEDRQESAREVEKSLLELQQLFLDMSVLVEAQGVQITQIEHQVEIAGDEVAGGTEALSEARVHQKNARKTLFWFVTILLILIVLLIVGVIVWFTVIKKSSSGMGRTSHFLLDFVNI